MIDFDKPVQTRDGREVIIYTTTAKGNKPVIGEFYFQDRWETGTWSIDGQWHERTKGKDVFDLVNVPQKHTKWMNVMKELGGVFSCGQLHEDHSRALISGENLRYRVACVPVTFTEGEGLNDE